MAVAPGAQLGPYVVISSLGAGGMGEVWRARDTTLGREVALKLLPPDVANDPQKRRRFEEEARAASALSHPNIVAVYEIASSGSGLYIAMERVEGRTLRQLLRDGPLPTKRLLEIAYQLADGTAKAHSAGIVHRDLKPENVMVSADGFVKILDFGLAKLRASDSQPASEGATETSPGMLLGTVAYMSPEQARAGAVDFRSDQFALGAVLYEAASGARAFGGSSTAETLAAILKEEPTPLAKLSPALPAPLRRTIERCLAKDPDERYASTRDLARDLRDIRDNLRSETVAPPAPPQPIASLVRFLPWALAVVATLAALLLLAGRSPAPAPAPAPTPKRFSVVLPVGHTLGRSDRGSDLAVLPDGSGFVYVADTEDGREMRLHTFRDGASRPIAGTQGGSEPFLSPDGRRLGFLLGRRVMHVGLFDASAPIVVSDSTLVWMGTAWGRDGIVVAGNDGLWRAPAAGGRLERLTTVDAARDEGRHGNPRYLPGERALLFTILGRGGRPQDATVAVLPPAGGGHRPLVRGASSPRYLPSGHLAYMQDSNLMAAPFDLESLRVTGPAFVAQPDVGVVPQFLVGQLDLAGDGTLVYVSHAINQREGRLAWIARAAPPRMLPLPPRPYIHPRLLPGAQTLVVEIEDSPHNIWYGDLRSGTLTQLTRDGANHRPVISADGRFMIFSSDRVTPRSQFRQATDGSGVAERLLEAKHPHNATSWSRDGRFLAYTESHPETGEDVWILPLVGERRPQPFLKTSFSEGEAVFSPDGRWLAYSSNETGRNEVVVSAFPGPGPRQQASASGGRSPTYSRDGRRLYYIQDSSVMAVDVGAGPGLSLGAPRVVAEIPGLMAVTSAPIYDVGAGEDALLALTYPSRSQPSRVEIVIDWLADVKQRGARPAGQ